MALTALKAYPNFGTRPATPPTAFPATIAAGAEWDSDLIAGGFGGVIAAALSDGAGALTIQRYADLAGAIPVGPVASVTLLNAGVTITIATPGVVTWTAHGLAAGTPVVFFTTGALPTGIVAGTAYYVSATGLTTDTFQISAALGGASIATSGSQSGTQTAGSPVSIGFADGLPYTCFNVRLTNTGGATANVVGTAILTGPLP